MTLLRDCYTNCVPTLPTSMLISIQSSAGFAVELSEHADGGFTYSVMTRSDNNPIESAYLNAGLYLIIEQKF